MKSNRHAALKWVLVPEAAKAAQGATVRLDADKSKHLRKVLRMEWEEEIRVCDGAGRLFEGWLEKSGDGAAVRLGELVRTEPKVPPVTELVICLPKNATMDWVVEKAVECGVTRITPVQSSRSVVRPNPDELKKYARRWETIADGALEQCERLWRPEILPPAEWRNFLASRAGASGKSVALVSELRETQDEQVALQAAWQELRVGTDCPISALIGPEGGLSETERQDLEGHGFKEASLGRAVLRVETAVIAALTLVRLARNIG